jgi:hypothetical protein
MRIIVRLRTEDTDFFVCFFVMRIIRTVVSAADPYGCNLDFLLFTFKYHLYCTHEAEWTPFQTHCFSGNLVTPGIDPRSLDL